MILNVFALIFVLGITFLHSMFGLFSGIINLLCSITALAVAFGFYELVDDLVTAQFHLPPQYTGPASLALLFVLTLTLLRFLADKYIRGNVRVPMYLDWGGGAVCGFINAQIVVGVMIPAFLMLPFGGRAGMFSRYERDPDNEVDPATQRVEFARNNIWLRSDQFAVGLFNLLSSGGLKGKTEFRNVYPDYPEWIFWTGNTVQSESLPVPLRDKQRDGYENGLALDTWWTQTTDIVEGIVYRKQAPTREQPNPTYTPQNYVIQPGNKLIGARVTLKQAVGDPAGKRGSPSHRFRPSMFRLVGDVRDEPRQVIPQIIGGADSNLDDKLRIADLDANFSPEGDDVDVDLYFEVPEDFTPRFLEYRRYARIPLPQATLAETPPDTRLAAGGGRVGREPAGGGTERTSGPMRFADTVNSGSTGEIDKLPFAMSASRLRREQVELRNGQVESGTITGTRAELTPPAGDTEVEQFVVPPDKRMFQVQTKTRQAAGLAGQVFNFVGGTMNQYFAISATGDQYQLHGYYALVQRDGEEYIELYFTPDLATSGFRGMLDFQTDGVRRLLSDQEDARLGLIFLVPRGAEITAVKAGTGTVDLGTRYKMSE
jgi:hypothetical protein